MVRNVWSQSLARTARFLLLAGANLVNVYYVIEISGRIVWYLEDVCPLRVDLQPEF